MPGVSLVPNRAPATSALFNNIIKLFTGHPDITDQPVLFTQNTDPASYALTVQHKPALAENYKGFKVQDKNGNSVFEVAALGSGPSKDMVSAYIDTSKSLLTVSNTRNWNSNSDFVVAINRVSAGAVGSHAPGQFTYVVASQPSDGFGGTTGIPDEVACNFDVFAVNTISDFGAGQNHDGSLRAIEIQTMVFQNTGMRTMAAMTAGCHTAVTKLSSLDSASPDTEYGDCGIIIHNQAQPYNGFGTTVRANSAMLVIGNPGWKHGYVYLDTDNTTLWYVDQGGTTLQKGNLNFKTAVPGQRIIGDLSNATDTNRLMFQTSTANGISDLGVQPVGTGNKGAFTAWAGSGVANSEAIRMYANSTTALGVLETFKTGVATARPLSLQPGQVEALRLETNGNVCMPNAGIATNATAGFFYIDSCAGTPTGVPTLAASTVPLVWDRNNHKLYAYSGGTWKASAAFV